MKTFTSNLLYEVNDIPRPYKDNQINFLGSDVSDSHLKQIMALKKGGQFLVLVNTVRDGFEGTKEHQKIHPSPITLEQIQELLNKYCDKVQCEVSNTPSADNEFWFMGWGVKK